jgi:hypothetical protein
MLGTPNTVTDANAMMDTVAPTALCLNAPPKVMSWAATVTNVDVIALAVVSVTLQQDCVNAFPVTLEKCAKHKPHSIKFFSKKNNQHNSTSIAHTVTNEILTSKKI